MERGEGSSKGAQRQRPVISARPTTLISSHQQRANLLATFELHPIRSLDVSILRTMEWEEPVLTYLKNIGWEFLLYPHPRIYPTSDIEFIASVSLKEIESEFEGESPTYMNDVNSLKDAEFLELRGEGKTMVDYDARLMEFAFEICALEDLLEAICSFLDSRTTELETPAYLALDELTFKQGHISQTRLRVQDVFAMTDSPTRILTQWNRNNQPVGDSSSLLAGFLGQVASNFGNFPVLYENWTQVPEQYKNNVYVNTIQDIANKNAANRAKLVIPHILGSKTLARKRDELETIHGREFSRAEMYQLSHKKPDGTFVNEEARELHRVAADGDFTGEASRVVATTILAPTRGEFEGQRAQRPTGASQRKSSLSINQVIQVRDEDKISLVR
ncbi:hypothetical protein Fmac_024937 [Flemingia macrophylla]|uniref:Uncharacterized protein n=1 Tax=Flemingia macrophylla TaxID=520843 RepID=A0ABD1LQU4_9FABA